VCNSVPAGRSCDISVIFKPKRPGTYTGLITLIDSASFQAAVHRAFGIKLTINRCIRRTATQNAAPSFWLLVRYLLWTLCMHCAGITVVPDVYPTMS